MKDKNKGGEKRGEKMGFIHARVKIRNLTDPSKYGEVELMVDTGALYSVVPGVLLNEIEVKPKRRRKFMLANGEMIERDVSDISYEFNEFEGAAPAIFGEPEDNPVLGVTALEAMGLEVDPITKKLKPTTLLLL